MDDPPGYRGAVARGEEPAHAHCESVRSREYCEIVKWGSQGTQLSWMSQPKRSHRVPEGGSCFCMLPNQARISPVLCGRRRGIQQGCDCGALSTVEYLARMSSPVASPAVSCASAFHCHCSVPDPVHARLLTPHSFQRGCEPRWLAIGYRPPRVRRYHQDHWLFWTQG